MSSPTRTESPTSFHTADQLDNDDYQHNVSSETEVRSNKGVQVEPIKFCDADARESILYSTHYCTPPPILL